MLNFKYKNEFASQVMNILPAGYIDKTICGCGLTTVALENNVDTIIAVPTVELIRNKTAQYPNERCNNSILGVYGNVTTKDIDSYVSANKVLKIMVTYDSLGKVEHLLDTCHLVIDESNKLLSSSSLKSKSKANSKVIDVTTKVFDIAKKYKDTVSFISATPIPLEYMPKWISEIEQVKIEWENTVKSQPILLERTYPFKALMEEILNPLNSNNELILANATIKKAIIFINSIEMIVKTIKEAKLPKDDVAIIAADNVENDVKIRGFNRLTNPKKLPKYTFVTSSGFEGIDLEDAEAISIVVSNTVKNYQMIDMLTDLKQAISRQRNKSNPNYNKFVYIYNQTFFSKAKEELESELDNRFNKLVEAIYLWEVAKKDNKRMGFEYTEDNKDFITYTNFIEEGEQYVVNENLFNADRYFILNIREQYQKGFDIKGNYETYEIVNKPKLVKDIDYKDLVDIYLKTGNIEEYAYKYEYYSLIKRCLSLYGKVWANQTYAQKMVDYHGEDYVLIIIDIQKKFKVDNIYPLKDIKNTLQKIYDKYKVKRQAKATDLYEFMQVKEISNREGRFMKIIDKTKTVK